jgi:nucleotide-binding universal stress UspA family protein
MSGTYQHIGVASAFSPRLNAVLAEAGRIAHLLESPLSIIHAAPHSDENAARFAEAIEQVALPKDIPILWSEGISPAEAILTAAREASIDLLVAGALERESEHRYFLGGVARELMRRASADLVLFTRPNETPADFKSLVIEVGLKEPNPAALTKSCQLANWIGIKEITFIAVVTPFDESAAAARGESAPNEDRLLGLVEEYCQFDGEIDTRIIQSNTGFSVCDFVETSGADLLMVATHEKDGVRVLPACMNWLHQVIPTNLWLISAAKTKASNDQ